MSSELRDAAEKLQQPVETLAALRGEFGNRGAQRARALAARAGAGEGPTVR